MEARILFRLQFLQLLKLVSEPVLGKIRQSTLKWQKPGVVAQPNTVQHVFPLYHMRCKITECQLADTDRGHIFLIT